MFFRPLNMTPRSAYDYPNKQSNFLRKRLQKILYIILEKLLKTDQQYISGLGKSAENVTDFGNVFVRY